MAQQTPTRRSRLGCGITLVFALCAALLVGTGSTALAKSGACEVDAVEEAAQQGAEKVTDLLEEARAALRKAQNAGPSTVRAAFQRLLFALQVARCANELGLLNGPNYNPGAPYPRKAPPQKQPGSGPDYPGNGPHPKTDGYRLPCLGPNGEQWEIWSDEVCRGPNGQTG